MEFISAIQDLLGDLFGDSGVSIRLYGSGVEIGLPSFNLPDLSVGAFSLKNLRIESALRISFRSDPMLFVFGFSSRENPFLLSVGIYGGSGYITLVLDTRRVVTFSLGFGFGLYGSLDLGIASGYAAVLGGVTYTSSRVEEDGHDFTKIEYSFFVRAFGSVRALSIVTVGVDFFLSLTIYESTPLRPSYSEGLVRVSYSVKIGFFRTSFTLAYSKRISGSGGQASAASLASASVPKETYTLETWKRYRAAFAS